MFLGWKIAVFYLQNSHNLIYVTMYPPKYLGLPYTLYLVHDSQLSHCSGLMLSSFSTLNFEFQSHFNFKNIYFKNLTLKYALYKTISRPELGMSTEIEYSSKYEYRNFFASKYG